MYIAALQRQIIEAMGEGATIDTIDESLIEPAALSQDQKAALWLFAWSLMSHAAQRATITAQLEATEA